MIIVSQDRTKIVNFDNLIQVYIAFDKDYDYVLVRIETIDSLYEDLGFYKTGKRAQEVLQEIITRYKNWENMKAGQPSGLCLPIYEMPKD